MAPSLTPRGCRRGESNGASTFFGPSGCCLRAWRWRGRLATLARLSLRWRRQELRRPAIETRQLRQWRHRVWSRTLLRETRRFPQGAWLNGAKLRPHSKRPRPGCLPSLRHDRCGRVRSACAALRLATPGAPCSGHASSRASKLGSGVALLACGVYPVSLWQRLAGRLACTRRSSGDRR